MSAKIDKEEKWNRMQEWLNQVASTHTGDNPSCRTLQRRMDDLAAAWGQYTEAHIKYINKEKDETLKANCIADHNVRMDKHDKALDQAEESLETLIAADVTASGQNNQPTLDKTKAKGTIDAKILEAENLLKVKVKRLEDAVPKLEEPTKIQIDIMLKQWQKIRDSLMSDIGTLFHEFRVLDAEGETPQERELRAINLQESRHDRHPCRHHGFLLRVYAGQQCDAGLQVLRQGSHPAVRRGNQDVPCLEEGNGTHGPPRFPSWPCPGAYS